MMFMQEVHFVSRREISSDITTIFHGVKYFMVAVNFSWRRGKFHSHSNDF